MKQFIKDVSRWTMVKFPTVGITLSNGLLDTHATHSLSLSHVTSNTRWAVCGGVPTLFGNVLINPQITGLSFFSRSFLFYSGHYNWNFHAVSSSVWELLYNFINGVQWQLDTKRCFVILIKSIFLLLSASCFCFLYHNGFDDNHAQLNLGIKMLRCSFE